MTDPNKAPTDIEALVAAWRGRAMITSHPGVARAYGDCGDRLDDALQSATAGRGTEPASDALGAWMSAALDDPNVCAEMKADIQAWFDAGQPLPTPPHQEQSGGDQTVSDLAMMLKRLCRIIKSEAPNSRFERAVELADKAIDLLVRKGLQGSPFRQEQSAGHPVDGPLGVWMSADVFAEMRADIQEQSASEPGVSPLSPQESSGHEQLGVVENSAEGAAAGGASSLIPDWPGVHGPANNPKMPEGEYALSVFEAPTDPDIAAVREALGGFQGWPVDKEVQVRYNRTDWQAGYDIAAGEAKATADALLPILSRLEAQLSAPAVSVEDVARVIDPNAWNFKGLWPNGLGPGPHREVRIRAAEIAAENEVNIQKAVSLARARTIDAMYKGGR